MIQEGPARWLGELLQATIWWAHALGAAVWVGGALVFLLVLRPALRAGGAGPGAGSGSGGGADRLAGLERAAGARFQEVVEVSAAVLAVSGVVLAVVRLSSGAAGPAYAVLLGVKVLLALAMFALATELRWSGRRPGGGRGRGALSRLTLFLGIVVVLLAVVLRRVFETGLSP
ncbi:MAG TPA: CopD family protein [Chloroflexota bacterium]|jgi:putative copper export protein|nr:CopD family protein [Chloroflexota bacterium]